MKTLNCIIIAFAVSSPALHAHAAEPASPKRPSVEQLQKVIVSRSPQTRVEAADSDRITARRIDIVDEKGVIRMTLSGQTPAPIIDGIQYKRCLLYTSPSPRDRG